MKYKFMLGELVKPKSRLVDNTKLGEIVAIETLTPFFGKMYWVFRLSDRNKTLYNEGDLERVAEYTVEELTH